MGEPVGATVGYSVRLERKVSRSTRLEIVTEGLLSRRISADPELNGIGLVVFDEFHERSLQCDLSFALALEVRRALRPDLRILVMSATLDPGEVAVRLGDAVEVRAEGRMFPVETKYLGDMPVSAAVHRAVRETDGDILCFLPGEAEIRRTCEALDGLAGCDVLPLYGSLPKDEQDRIFARSTRRKVILSTSIAETSLTIPGITCVIDSGLMRVPRFSPVAGMSRLETLQLPKDRAEQRRGRAGRVAPGVCYRLWDERSEALRPSRANPEILDADLAPLVMASAAWGALRRTDLPWMTPPPASAWDQASRLLMELGALDADGRLTPHGEAMSRLPAHPRLANMLLKAGPAAAMLAAIVEEGSRAERETDIGKILDEVAETPNRPRSRRIRLLAERFAAAARGAAAGAFRGGMSEGAMLALAYPDRIAKNRGNGTFRMTCGRGAAFDRLDPLAKSEYVVCCELDDRPGDARVFLAAPVAESEILELYGGETSVETTVEWDARSECVKAVATRRLKAMPVDVKPVAADGPKAAGKVLEALMRGVCAKGVANLPCWTKESMQLRDRMSFAHARADPSWPLPDDEAVLAALAGFAGGMSKWRDLEKIDMAKVLDSILAAAGKSRRELDHVAPAKIQVPTGSMVSVDYGGDEPVASARLQECFGMMDTPKVANGTVPVVMTLLSPAYRPVQVTKDLAGFWRGAYQTVRKDMRGRYPKHYWPEDPLTAVATRRTKAKM
jgi:ATP-dependent helicase HrpB